MIRKPHIGKPVITGDPKCCDSLHKKGTLGVIINIDNIDGIRFIRVKDENGETWWHCRKCLSPIKKVKK